MAECIITMNSMTYAEKAKRTALGAGIRGQIVSIDPSVTKRGCAYGLSLPCRDAARILQVFEKKGIRYGEVLGDGYPFS